MISVETDRSEMCRAVHDLMMAATLCRIDLTPWLLASLLEQLHKLCRTIPLLVPHNVYLPAPPMYCPQPVQQPSVCAKYLVLFNSIYNYLSKLSNL